MKRDQRFSRSFRAAVLVSGTLVGFLGTAITAVAHGNSHMIMQDKNNLQIADLILQWIDESVGKTKDANK
jgi:hypothetical protein